MKKHLPLLALILAVNTLTAQMIPCRNGKAGKYPCKGYDLMSHIPAEVLGTRQSNGNDIWGWTDPRSGREYAVVGLTNATAFVDVTDPINPVNLGKLMATGNKNSIWRDIKIYKDHAFIVADAAGKHGMQVFDLTRLRNVKNAPTNFRPDVTFDEVGSCHNIVINETVGTAYLVGCSTFSGGPVFVDISDPKNPRGLGGYSSGGYSHDAQVVTYNGPDREHNGKQIYIGSNGNSNKIVILDVTNPSKVIELGRITYNKNKYIHQGWFTEDGRYFILGDELDEQEYGFKTKTLIFDFLDLDNPKLSSIYYGTTKAIDHNGYILGNEFFLANYQAGLRVLDLSNVGARSNALKEIAYFDTYPEGDSAAFNGAWSVYPYFKSKNIVVDDIERGLFVLRKSGTFSTPDDKLDSFTLLPNPTSSTSTLSTTATNPINTVEIFNVLGQNIFQKENINKIKFELPIQNLSKGVYLIKINTNITKKLILK